MMLRRPGRDYLCPSLSPLCFLLEPSLFQDPADEAYAKEAPQSTAGRSAAAVISDSVRCSRRVSLEWMMAAFSAI